MKSTLVEDRSRLVKSSTQSASDAGRPCKRKLSRRQVDAMTALAFLNVTLLSYRFLVALWAAMRTGYHCQQKQKKSRTDWMKRSKRASCVGCFHDRQLDCIKSKSSTGKELHDPSERGL